MAKESSILKLNGQLDGMSFYKTSEGYQVRSKGGIEKNRIMNDHNFARTRENMNEFANINSAGKMIRNGIGTFLNRAKDARSSSRLVSIIAKVKNMDEVSLRGERTFANGIAIPEAKVLLEGFNFNKAANLDFVLKKPYHLNTDTGAFQLTAFYPEEDMNIPPAATHITLGYACCGLSPETFEAETVYGERSIIPVGQEAQDVGILLDALPTSGSVKMHFVLVEFLQEVNSKMYPLKNGSYNALAIVKVV